jgi:hypothetical protein
VLEFSGGEGGAGGAKSDLAQVKAAGYTVLVANRWFQRADLHAGGYEVACGWWV